MAEQYTIIRTSRYGHQAAKIRQLGTLMKKDVKRKDDVISACNEMASKDFAAKNEIVIYDVVHNNEMGESNIIHTVEIDGGESV